MRKSHLLFVVNTRLGGRAKFLLLHFFKNKMASLNGLAAHFGIAPEDLTSVPREVLQAAMGQGGLNWTVVEQGQVHVAIAKQTPRQETVSLLEHFREEKRDKLQPWRLEEAKVTQQLAMVHAAYEKPDAWEALQKEFTGRAKLGILSETEVLLGSHVLFCNDLDREAYALMAMLLTIPPGEQRLAFHNWSVAQTMSDTRKIAHGPEIAALKAPLFPETAELEVVNSKLFATQAQGITGGEAMYSQHVGLFTNKQRLPEKVLVKGGGNALPSGFCLPVQHDSEGRYFIDAAPILAEVQGRMCFSCGQAGHIARNCPLSANPGRGGSRRPYRGGRGRARGGGEEEEKPTPVPSQTPTTTKTDSTTKNAK
jgi:hypothetical protein